MLCCVIPMAVAAVVTFVTGSTAAMFTGPMLYVTIALTALSMVMMGYYAWKLFSKYVLGNDSDSCCSTASETPSCCSSKAKTSDHFKPDPVPQPKNNDVVIEIEPTPTSSHCAKAT